jgi:transcriptional antiterminator RfaH
MPILPPEPDVFPAGLLEADASFDGPSEWWVAHTRPRQEKALARQLLAAGVSFYLPQTNRRCLVRGRVLTSRLPLFPGYVFLRTSREERLRALATRRIARLIDVPEPERLESDLRQVHRLIAAGLPVTPEEKLGPGSWVEVTHGPLAGLTGQIVRSATGRKFVVRIDFIQRGAAVTLDDCVLTPVEGFSPYPVLN